jgi:pimeloyl-ACP methyl ester carboxylesterase
MGGINAYLCAARHPALFEELVILDVGPGSITSDWAVNTFTPMLQSWAEAAYASPDEAVADYLSGGPTPHDEELTRFVLNNLRRRPDGMWTWRFDAIGLRSWLTDSPDAEAQWAALRQIACPTLVVRAGSSPVLSAASAERMSRELQNGRGIEIAGGWHDVHINKFDALMPEVRAFLTNP